MTRNSFIILSVIVTGLFVSCKPIYKCGEPKPEKKQGGLLKNLSSKFDSMTRNLFDDSEDKS